MICCIYLGANWSSVLILLLLLSKQIHCASKEQSVEMHGPNPDSQKEKEAFWKGEAFSSSSDRSEKKIASSTSIRSSSYYQCPTEDEQKQREISAEEKGYDQLMAYKFYLRLDASEPTWEFWEKMANLHAAIWYYQNSLWSIVMGIGKKYGKTRGFAELSGEWVQTVKWEADGRKKEALEQKLCKFSAFMHRHRVILLKMKSENEKKDIKGDQFEAFLQFLDSKVPSADASSELQCEVNDLVVEIAEKMVGELELKEVHFQHLNWLFKHCEVFNRFFCAQPSTVKDKLYKLLGAKSLEELERNHPEVLKIHEFQTDVRFYLYEQFVAHRKNSAEASAAEHRLTLTLALKQLKGIEQMGTGKFLSKDLHKEVQEKLKWLKQQIFGNPQKLASAHSICLVINFQYVVQKHGMKSGINRKDGDMGSIVATVGAAMIAAWWGHECADNWHSESLVLKQRKEFFPENQFFLVSEHAERSKQMIIELGRKTRLGRLVPGIGIVYDQKLLSRDSFLCIMIQNFLLEEEEERREALRLGINFCCWVRWVERELADGQNKPQGQLVLRIIWTKAQRQQNLLRKFDAIFDEPLSQLKGKFGLNLVRMQASLRDLVRNWSESKVASLKTMEALLDRLMEPSEEDIKQWKGQSEFELWLQELNRQEMLAQLNKYPSKISSVEQSLFNLPEYKERLDWVIWKVELKDNLMENEETRKRLTSLFGRVRMEMEPILKAIPLEIAANELGLVEINKQANEADKVEEQGKTGSERIERKSHVGDKDEADDAKSVLGSEVSPLSHQQMPENSLPAVARKGKGKKKKQMRDQRQIPKEKHVQIKSPSATDEFQKQSKQGSPTKITESLSKTSSTVTTKKNRDREKKAQSSKGNSSELSTSMQSEPLESETMAGSVSEAFAAFNILAKTQPEEKEVAKATGDSVPSYVVPLEELLPSADAKTEMDKDWELPKTSKKRRNKTKRLQQQHGTDSSDSHPYNKKASGKTIIGRPVQADVLHISKPIDQMIFAKGIGARASEKHKKPSESVKKSVEGKIIISEQTKPKSTAIKTELSEMKSTGMKKIDKKEANKSKAFMVSHQLEALTVAKPSELIQTEPKMMQEQANTPTNILGEKAKNEIKIISVKGQEEEEAVLKAKDVEKPALASVWTAKIPALTPVMSAIMPQRKWVPKAVEDSSAIDEPLQNVLRKEGFLMESESNGTNPRQTALQKTVKKLEMVLHRWSIRHWNREAILLFSGSYLLQLHTTDSDIDCIVLLPFEEHTDHDWELFYKQYFFGNEIGPDNQEKEVLCDLNLKNRHHCPNWSLYCMLCWKATVSSLLKFKGRDRVPMIELEFHGFHFDLLFVTMPKGIIGKAIAIEWASGSFARRFGGRSVNELEVFRELLTFLPFVDILIGGFIEWMGVTNTDERKGMLLALSGYRANLRIRNLLAERPGDNFQLAYSALKLWSKKHFIYGSKFGLLNGTTLTMMLLQEFLRVPFLPVPDLLALFFQTYSNWKWPRPVHLGHASLDRREISIGGDCSSLDWSASDEERDRRKHLRVHEYPYLAEHAKLVWPVIVPGYPIQNAAFNVNAWTKQAMQREFGHGLSRIEQVKKAIRAKTQEWAHWLEGQNFAEKYDHFVAIICAAESAQKMCIFCDFVESRVRLQLLFAFGDLSQVQWMHANPKKVRTDVSCPPGEEIAQIPAGNNWHCTIWLVGIQLVEGMEKEDIDQILKKKLFFDDFIERKREERSRLEDFSHKIFKSFKRQESVADNNSRTSFAEKETKEKVWTKYFTKERLKAWLNQIAE